MLIQPFIPHLSEEMWSLLGNDELAINQSWPKTLAKKKDMSSKLVIQINGKLKEIIEIDTDANEKAAVEIAKKNEKINKLLLSMSVVKIIYVPNKILNFVLK